MVGTEETALDLITHRGAGTVIGAFRCPRSHPRFTDSGPIQNDIFVFPRSSVRIRHAGGPSFVADHTVSTVYNRGQVYDRAMVSEEGDRSDWFAVPREAAIEAVIANGLEPSGRGPFSFPFVRVEDRTYLEQRRLFRQAEHGAPAAAIEEGIYALLDEVVLSAAAERARRTQARDIQAREIAEAIRSLLSARFEEKWPLSRLGQHLGISPFSLCRAFRRATGSTIHSYLVTLRLRASLERLERSRRDISAIALDLGFAGHSHFSLSFGRRFDRSPSAFREEQARF